MPSEFFNQLVQARREGTAPPQVAEAPAEVASGEVTFRAPSKAAPVVCSGCPGVLIDAEGVPAHADWHRQQST